MNDGLPKRKCVQGHVTLLCFWKCEIMSRKRVQDRDIVAMED